MESDQELDKGLRNLKIIWLSMLGLLPLYAWIGYYVAPHLNIAWGEETVTIVRIVCYLFALGIVFSIPFLRRFLLTGNRREQRSVQIQKLPDPHVPIQRYIGVMIATWSLGESIALYGLILFFFGQNTVEFFLFLLVSAAVLCFYRPSKRDMRDFCQGHLRRNG